MLLAELEPNYPIGKVLGPFLFFFTSGVPLLVCLVFAVIAYRRTRHSGFLWLVIGLGLSLFSHLLYSRLGDLVRSLLSGTFIDTLLSFYIQFISPYAMFVCLAVGIWRLGIGRHAVPQRQPTNTPE